MRLIIYLLLLIEAVYCATKLTKKNTGKITASARVCIQGTILKGDEKDAPSLMLLDSDELCAVKWHVSKNKELIKVESAALEKDKLSSFSKRNCGWLGEENSNLVFVTTSNLTGSNSRMWTKAARFPECFESGDESGPNGWKEALIAIKYGGYETVTKIEKISNRKYKPLLEETYKSTNVWDPFDLPLEKNERVCFKGDLYNSDKSVDMGSPSLRKYSTLASVCSVEWTIPVDIKNKAITDAVQAKGKLKDVHNLKDLGKEQNCTDFFVTKPLDKEDVLTVVTLMKNMKTINDWKTAAERPDCFIPETKKDDKEIQNLWLNAIAAAKDTELAEDEDFKWVMQLSRVQAGEETLTARERTPVPSATTSSSDGKSGKKGKKSANGSEDEGFDNAWWIVLIVMSVTILVVLFGAIIAVLLKRRADKRENPEDFLKSSARETRSRR